MKVKKKDRIVNIFKEFFSYTTVKEAKTYNLKIAIVYRTIQFTVIWYVLGYDITQNKSYQATESGTSTVVTKVKGIGYTHYNTSNSMNSSSYNLININQENFKIFDTSSKNRINILGLIG